MQQVLVLNWSIKIYIDQPECFGLIDHFYISVSLKAIDLRGDSDTNGSARVRNSTSVPGGAALTED